MDAWPHQVAAVETIKERTNRGVPARVCIVANTGAGKSRIMTDAIIQTGARTALYTHRKMLLAQTSSVLKAAGIAHGVRAAGYEPDSSQRVQLCSTQTIASRCLKGGESVSRADLVLIDEAHVQKSGTMLEILAQHKGAHVVSLTATPVGVAPIADELVQVTSTSELRKCGALLPCKHYAPSEIDTAGITPGRTGEFTPGDLQKVWHPPVIFGSVYKHFERLNKDRRPTILFAPGVAESQWLAEMFYAKGIGAAHISGEKIWANGHTYEASQANRDQLLEMSRTGEITVLCNRFVMREGINAPWLGHLIYATAFGSVCSYLQAGGRVLRNHPSLDHVTCQDHGGNWHRHGSLNANRTWQLDGTANLIRSERQRKIREKEEIQPITCPKCFAVRTTGVACHDCGHTSRDKRRAVIQRDGSLKLMNIAGFSERRTYKKPDAQKRWESYYHRAKRSRNRMNFNQAAALFMRENSGAWPSRDLQFMPTQPMDWYKPVAEVDYSKLS